MISRDGGWVSVMPSDGGAMCFMYHVQRAKGSEQGEVVGKGTETGKGVSAQCDGEHSNRKQMSLPKHASCPAYLSARRNALFSSKTSGRRLDGTAGDGKGGEQTIFGGSRERRFDCILRPRDAIVAFHHAVLLT